LNITHTLQEFGTRHGHPNLTLTSGGSVDLALDDLPLTLQEVGEELLMLSGFPCPFLDGQRLVAILKSCEQRSARAEEPGLQVGTRGEASDIWLIAGLRWPVNSVSAAALERGAQSLRRFREDWRS
jgi:hypothetical protein